MIFENNAVRFELNSEEQRFLLYVLNERLNLN